MNIRADRRQGDFSTGMTWKTPRPQALHWGRIPGRWGKEAGRGTSYEKSGGWIDSDMCLSTKWPFLNTHWVTVFKYTRHCCKSQTVFIVMKIEYMTLSKKCDILTSSSTVPELNAICRCEHCKVWCSLNFRSVLSWWIGLITSLRYVHHCSDNSCSMVKQN